MQALGDAESARECFAQSLIAAESVVRHCQTANTLDALGVAYYRASFYEEGENREAYLGNALAIYKGLTKDYPHNKRFEKNLRLVKNQLEQQ